MVGVVIHLGMAKTGTSSLQYLLAANREVLLRHGVLYPTTPGRARHTRLGMFVKSDDELVRTPAWHRMGKPDPRRFRRRFRRRLLAEIAEAAPARVVLSDEALFGLDPESIVRLRRLTERIGGPVRVVVYLRRQDDHVVSRYQQEVKTGETRRLAQWIAEGGNSGYDYHQRLCRWRDVLEPHAVVARRFEPTTFAGGSLHSDFLDAAEIGVAADALAPVPDRNESLDAETVEFLRILNLHRLENEQVEVRYVDNAELVERLRDHRRGPALTLPEAVLDETMRRWEASNRATAEEFLDDPQGILFREPRTSRPATSTQRLEPSRVEYFADLAGLPDHLRAPLRRIADREATAATGPSAL